MCAPEAVLPIQTDDVSTSVGIVALLVRLMKGAASLSDRSGWSRSASPRSFSTGARPLHGPQDRKDSEHIRPALARGAAPDQLLGRHRDRRGRAGQYTRRSRIQYQAQQAAWSRFARALPPIQDDRSCGDPFRQGAQGCRSTSREAERLEIRLGHPFGSRKQMGEGINRAWQRFSKRLYQTPHQGARASNGHVLANNRAHRQLKTIERPRDAQPWAPGNE